MRADRRALRAFAAACALAGALAACGRDADAPRDADGRAATAASGLPQPQAVTGAVTGMPGEPGPGDVPLGGESAAPAGVDPALAPLEDNPETGLLAPAGAASPELAPAVPEPSPEEAAAVIRTYYAAINALDYARAYALWSDGGRSSGQSPEQFAAGFADTSTVMVDIGTPGQVDAGAGSRFIEIPVSVRAQQADGSFRRYEGRYVLRRAVADGASQGQRAWRIASADLRETSAP